MPDDLSENTSEVVDHDVSPEVITGGSAEVTETETAETPVDTSSAEAEAATAAPVVPAYTPDYNYKVYEEQKEIDEWARPFIKDKDTEDKFRKLFAGAGATDQMTAKREAQQQQYAETQNQYETLKSQLSEASEYVERGDLEGFFKAIGLPEEKIYQHVLNKLNYEGMTHEQKAQHDNYHNELRSNITLEKRLAAMEGQLRTDQVQTRTRELDTVLNQPEVQTAARAFDSRLSQPGAFRDECIRHAWSEWNLTGRDLTADQAARAVLQKYGQTTTAQPGGVDMTTQTGKPPVIPNVAGRNVSPTKKQPKSLDDLRKLSSEMEADAGTMTGAGSGVF